MSVSALKKVILAGLFSGPDSSGSGGGGSTAPIKGIEALVENALKHQQQKATQEQQLAVKKLLKIISKGDSFTVKKIMELIQPSLPESPPESRYERNIRLLEEVNKLIAAGDLKEAERIVELLDPEFSKQIFIKLFNIYFRRKDYEAAKRIAFLSPSLSLKLYNLECLFDRTKDLDVGGRIHELIGRMLDSGICLGTALHMDRTTDKGKGGDVLVAEDEAKARFLQALSLICNKVGSFEWRSVFLLKNIGCVGKSDEEIEKIIGKDGICILRLSNKNSLGAHIIFIYQNKETREYFFIDSELVNEKGYALIRRFSSKNDLEKALTYHLMKNYQFNMISQNIEISRKGLKPRLGSRRSNFLSERFNMTEENFYNLIKKAIEAKQKDKVKALVKIAILNGYPLREGLSDEELSIMIKARLADIRNAKTSVWAAMRRRLWIEFEMNAATAVMNLLADRQEENEGGKVGENSCENGKRSTNPHARRGL